MQLALIPPMEHLSDLHQTGYQLCLAHLALANKRYRAMYETLRRMDDFVILDNGAFEGSLVKAEELCALAISMNVNEIVIPDSLQRKDVTIAMAEGFHALETSYETKLPRKAFVIQGANGYEMAECLEWANKQEWIDTIMIPRHTAETTNRARARISFAIESYKNNPEQQIHLLGASPLWPYEFKEAATYDFIRGMDTSMPYVYGYHEASLHASTPLNRPDDYFNITADKMQHHYMDINVREMIDGIYNR